MYKTELYHHGVKGMKWGVRRYQNFDGSYTKAGMQRYNKSLANYERQKGKRDRYKAASKNRKYYDKYTGQTINMQLNKADRQIAKHEYKKQKYETKKAKAQLEKDYNHLKEDYKADKGKKLYQEGYRIRDDYGGKIRQAGSLAVGVALTAHSCGLISDQVMVKAVASSAGVAALGAGVKVYNKHKDDQLRAYYSHTSNY